MATTSDDPQLAMRGARLINTDTDPDELVLPEASMERLRRLGQWLTQPPPVMREWGLHRYIDGGLRALFRGPAGTGKTMAAIAIARWSDRALFHVDLAAVVSDSIGETEKILERIFEQANKDNAILLFDEADGLLGKRTEVKDAHDRYANIEISHLLRKLEPYEGLAILATNHCSELDQSIVTRLDGIVDFPMPDEAARYELWRRVLSATKLPKSHELDAHALAKDHALSGAEILRATRIAALLAASDAKPLDMDLLQRCAAERMAMRKAPS